MGEKFWTRADQAEYPIPLPTLGQKRFILRIVAGVSWYIGTQVNRDQQLPFNIAGLGAGVPEGAVWEKLS
jgi:hypothetical protein